MNQEIPLSGGDYIENVVDAQWGIAADIGVIIIGQTANYNYSGVNSTVDLSGLISVIGQTANYDYNALNAAITLQGPIVINPKNIIRVRRRSNTIRVI